MRTPEIQEQEQKGLSANKAFPASSLVAGFGPIQRKVRFPNEKAALKGFGLLLRSGGAETLGDNVYGLSSARQIRLLQDQKIPFEVVD